MITVTTQTQTIVPPLKVNAADLAILIGAVATAGVIELPTGKTLADVVRLQLNVLPAPQADGTVAVLSALLK